MNRSRRLRIGAGLFTCLATLWSAVPSATATDTPAKDVPPVAAADAEGMRHGTRSKAADGSLLVWDKVTGIFMAPDRKNTYWTDDQFYQYEEGVWLTSKKLAGPWGLVAQAKVPEEARGRHAPLRGAVTAKLPSGREAVYAPPIKSYKVAGLKGVFLFDGGFYRYDNGVWLTSSKEDGPWAPTSMKILPQVLRRALPVPEVGQKVSLPSGETLVFEGQGNLYGVEGRTDTVYFDGAFYERRENLWFTSPTSSSGFNEIAIQKVPGAVRTKYHKPNDPKIKPEGKEADKTAANKDKAPAKDTAAAKNKKTSGKDAAANKKKTPAKDTAANKKKAPAKDANEKKAPAKDPAAAKQKPADAKPAAEPAQQAAQPATKAEAGDAEKE